MIDNTTVLPELDLPLLRKELEWIEWQATVPAVEREWHQGSWRRLAVFGRNCRTVMCIAGHTCDDAGVQWESDDGKFITDENGMPTTAAVKAQKLLGLAKWEADWLFHPLNTATKLRQIATDIAAARGLIL